MPLILYILLSGLAGTDRKRYRIWSKQTSKYGKDVPAQTITILLGTVFWYGLCHCIRDMLGFVLYSCC